MNAEPQDAKEAAFLEGFKKLDQVQRLIFIGALRALQQGIFTHEDFEAWVQSRFDRHRAGEKLNVGDLFIPGMHPEAGCAE